MIRNGVTVAILDFCVLTGDNKYLQQEASIAGGIAEQQCFICMLGASEFISCLFGGEDRTWTSRIADAEATVNAMRNARIADSSRASTFSNQYAQ